LALANRTNAPIFAAGKPFIPLALRVLTVWFSDDHHLEGVRHRVHDQQRDFDTDVLARQMYADMFVTAQVSRGSALAVILFVAVIPLIWYNVRTLHRERETG